MKYVNFLSIFCGLFICFSISSHAEEAAASGLETRAFQLSFITPLGTNGWDSWNIINKFSLNLLTGYAGGVNGTEFSGFGSVLRTHMKGAQFSGFGNVVLGETCGAQFAGFMNIDHGPVKGGIFAGFLNFSGQEARGAQVAGFANINTGNNHGAQVAGFSNINTGETNGLQLAGFFNYTKVLSGVQVGILNYADSSEGGVPIGLLSFVKNGYRAFEISANESLYGVSSFKTGTRSFYNILSVGGGYRNKRSLFAWGWGMGTLIAVAEKLDIAIEGQGLQVNEDEWFTSGTNFLAKASVSLAWNIAEHFSIFCGPSWNVAVSNIKHENGSAIAPWSVFDKTTEGGTNIKMYPGLSAGLRF
jgi:hypothetical protein